MPEHERAPTERGDPSPREAHARRKVRMRRGVAAASLATFALTWGVIAGTGSMGASTSTAGASASAAAAASQRQDDGGSGLDDGAQSQSQSQSQPTPLTTRQS